MKRNVFSWIKLHRKKRKTRITAGILTLVLAAAFLAGIFGNARLQVEAAGSIQYDTDDGIWKKWNNSDAADIVMRNGFFIRQSLTANQVTLKVNGEDKQSTPAVVTDANGNQTIQITTDYYADSTFSVNTIQSNVNYAQGTPSVKIETGEELNPAEGAYNYFICSSGTPVTYYRVVTEEKLNIEEPSETQKTIFDDFESEIRSSYKKNHSSVIVSDQMLMSRGIDEMRSAFRTEVENYMSGKGAKKYTPGTEIPLIKDGKKVIRVDMLTFNAADFYFSVSYGGGTSSESRDYDVGVYTVHSYCFNGPSMNLEAPLAELESGREISGKVSGDDAVVLNIDNPYTDAQAAYRKVYNTGYAAAVKEYCLSSSKITDFTDVSWVTYNSQNSQNSQPIALSGNKKYLYVRTRAEQVSESLYTYKNSVPKEYVLDYVNEKPDKVVSSSLPGNTIAGIQETGDQIILTTSAADICILYTRNEEFPNLEKVSDLELRKELNRVSSGTGISYVVYGPDNHSYVRVNGIWYQCLKAVNLYEQPIQAVYDDEGECAIYAKVLQDGKKVDVNGDDIQAITYTKMNPPVIRLESGMDISDAEVYIPEEDRVISMEPDGRSGKIQYSLSESKLQSYTGISWTEWDGNPVDMAGKGYLYVRILPVGADQSAYVGSAIKEYHKRHITDAPASVRAELNAGTSVQDTSGDQAVLTTSEQNALILYTTDGSEPSMTKVTDLNLRITLNSQAAETSATSVLYENIRYVRVNGLWYVCGASVKLYEAPIPVSFTGGQITIRAKALADGKKTDESGETFLLQKLDAPAVKLESGMDIASAISYDDTLIGLTSPYTSESGLNAGYEGAELQYYLSDRKMDNIPDKSWLPWKAGSSVSLDRKQYLYTRVQPTAAEYMGSSPKEYVLYYIKKVPGSVSAKTYAGGEEIGGGVDYGDEIELIELTASEDKALIFYTLDGSKPQFKKVPYEDRAALDQAYGAASAGSITLNGKRYVKVNRLWYLCEGSTELYEKMIKVDETIYTNNYLTVNAQAIADSYHIGTPDRFSYSFSMRDQVAAPTATPEDGETVQMGSMINLLCETINSRIFYTLNGSAPVVNIVGTELVLGEGTYEYKNKPIVLTEQFAEYGSGVTITAQACCFALYNDPLTNNEFLTRTMQDSPLTRFAYKVSDQAVVGMVTSVPVTSSDQRAEVEIGSRIYLYSATEGAEIFYTLDGTEPVFDGATLTPKNDSTYKYQASSGILVPEMTDSSLFTITASAYKDGLAASDISRLIFQYPAAVSMPYATPAAGAVTEGTSVTLKTATENAIIYYEVSYGDQTPPDPTENSKVYDASNPFIITKKTTVKAYAVKSGMESSVATFVYTVSEKLSVPEPSIASGSVVAAGTVVGLKADEGASIYYTTDGSDPKKADNKNILVGDSVIINGDVGAVVTVKTYASRNGYSDSEIGYYSYSVSAYAGGIYADKEDGSTVKNGETVQLNTDVSDAKIYYTVDGSTPTEDSASGSTVTITGNPGENVIVKAIAIAEGTDKAISSATFTYTIMDKLAAPSASVPDGAVFTEEGEVVLTVETGKIYYTVNGEEPSTASTLFKKSITVDQSMTIKAIAVADDYQRSDVSTFTYGFADQVEAPQANFASGEVEMGTMITFATETEGATIYYRTDGADPDPNEKDGLETYTGPIQMDRAATFKMIAVKEHMQNSKVVTVGYTVREPMVEDVTEEEEEQYNLNNTGRLQSRDSFKGMESGPAFTDVVLKNATFGAVVSADEGVLPDGVQLKVEQTQVTDSANRMVKQIIQDTYGIVASYDVTLLVNGEETQPDGVIEIGLPIPVKYQNSIIHVARIEDDGSIQVFDTRRSNGVAYAKVDHLSVYSIAAPVEYEQEQSSVPWFLILYSAAVGFLTLGILLIYQSRKRNREDEEQDV